VDYQLTTVDSIHLNWATAELVPDAEYLDAENATPWSGCMGSSRNGPERHRPGRKVVGHTDQRSKIGSFNIAPSWTHVLNAKRIYLGAFVRRDDYNYYPSSDPFADLGPPSLQRQSVVSPARSPTRGCGPIFPT